MKRFCKRSLCLLFTAALLFGLLPALGTGAAAYSLEERQRAAVLTAFAYYDKGRPVQYDSLSLTPISRVVGGVTRTTQDCAPEYATPDETLYTVCSNYCYQVYYNAFGYRLLNKSAIYAYTGALTKFNTDDPLCAYKYDSAVDDTPRDEAITKFVAALQPGDVVVHAGKVGNNGHAMFWIGDYFGDGVKYILHSSGSKYDLETGSDVIECNPGAIETIPGKISPYRTPEYRNDGGISLQPGEEYFRRWYTKSKNCVLVALRPLNVMTEAEYPLTEAAKGRLKYPRLLYNRTASPYTRFNDVEEGGTLTLRIELKNCSENAYTLPVKETIPDGVTFAKASHDGAVSGNEITWSVPLNAGETKALTVDYIVTAKRGETLVFEDGSAGGIPSNTLRIPVGGKHLTNAENALLAEVAEGKHTELFKDMPKDAIPAQIWQKLLKLNVPLPTPRTLVKDVLEKAPFAKSIYVYTPREDLTGDALTFRKMLVPEFCGGIRYGDMESKRRVLDLKCSFLQPGDIVYQITKHTQPSVGQTLVYLGNEKFLWQTRTDRGARVVDFFELQRSHTFELFFALRPTLAYDDVHVLAALPEEKKLSFTDVKESDWFYTYVKELVKDGTISGMSETTFAPNGNLTYGQALKLIALAVGEKEPAKTGAHWASGYLTLAKDKKWLTKDVDLDAVITRLELCKIAAKAKNLLSQPEKNPFKDTENMNVLALYKAGVINGMTATTFAPNGLLTRAQISKIIFLLRDAEDAKEETQAMPKDKGD